MAAFGTNLLLFKHFNHAVILKMQLRVFGVTGQPECVVWLYPHCAMIGGTCKLIIFYHSVLGKETFSCALESSIPMNAMPGG